MSRCVYVLQKVCCVWLCSRSCVIMCVWSCMYTPECVWGGERGGSACACCKFSPPLGSSYFLELKKDVVHRGCLLGLTLIAFGTGGIKPCVSRSACTGLTSFPLFLHQWKDAMILVFSPMVHSFGGDQFKPTQTRLLQSFFSLFYISINVGSIASTFLTPIIRKNVSFWAAFLLPAVLLAV